MATTEYKKTVIESHGPDARAPAADVNLTDNGPSATGTEAHGPDARATVATKTKKTVKDGKVVKEERKEDIEEVIPLKKTTMLTKDKEASLTAENNLADEHPPIDKRIYIGAGVVALSALAVGLYVGLRSRQ